MEDIKSRTMAEDLVINVTPQFTEIKNDSIVSDNTQTMESSSTEQPTEVHETMIDKSSTHTSRKHLPKFEFTENIQRSPAVDSRRSSRPGIDVTDSTPSSQTTLLNYSTPDSALFQTAGTLLSSSSATGSKKFLFKVSRDPDDKPSLLRTKSATAPVFKQHIQTLKDQSVEDQQWALMELLSIITQTWSLEVIGKELAYELCDILRVEGGLDMLVQLCSDESSKDVQLLAARILSQCLSVNNRQYVASNHLKAVVESADKVKSDAELSIAMTEILECLFKDSEVTCTELIALGALDTILYFCKMRETGILRNCADALANLALFGGHENQLRMIQHQAQLWLFKLAFTDDDSVKYYALLAIAVLSANKDLEKDVVESGTLKLVYPFLRSRDPDSFRRSDSQHIHGQSDEWLKRLMPVLKCRREEGLNLVTFHFAMESSIRQERGNISLFKTGLFVEQMTRLATGTAKLAAKFACHTLRVVDEKVPRKLSSRVSLWTNEDVICWLHQLGLGAEIIKRFEDCQVDGDLLLLMTEENLSNDVKISNGIVAKRFIRELNELRQMSDYTLIDPTMLNHFLQDIHPELCRYTYRMLKSRISRFILPMLKEDHLLSDCGVENGVHRLMILEAAKALPHPSAAKIRDGRNVEDSIEEYDAFISYRREGGALLASLLSVYLKIRGKKVFLDVEGLLPGEFDKHILTTIAHSKSFILVLSPKTLDRCLDDHQCKDWVHKELVSAIENKCNIIPVIQPGYKNANVKRLPKDIRAVESYQGIPWNHDYHDACIDKLIHFMEMRQPLLPAAGPTGSRLKQAAFGLSVRHSVSDADCVSSKGDRPVSPDEVFDDVDGPLPTLTEEKVSTQQSISVIESIKDIGCAMFQGRVGLLTRLIIMIITAFFMLLLSYSYESMFHMYQESISKKT